MLGEDHAPGSQPWWMIVAASSELARTHSAGGRVENARQHVAVAGTSPVASFAARKSAPPKAAFTGGERLLTAAGDNGSLSPLTLGPRFAPLQYDGRRPVLIPSRCVSWPTRP